MSLAWIDEQRHTLFLGHKFSLLWHWSGIGSFPETQLRISHFTVVGNHYFSGFGWMIWFQWNICVVKRFVCGGWGCLLCWCRCMRVPSSTAAFLYTQIHVADQFQHRSWHLLLPVPSPLPRLLPFPSLPLPCRVCPQPCIPILRETKSRSFAPPEWILLDQAPPLSRYNARNPPPPSARNTPTGWPSLAAQPPTPASLQPHWIALSGDVVIGWPRWGLVSVGWLPWCPGRSVRSHTDIPNQSQSGWASPFASHWQSSIPSEMDSKNPQQPVLVCSHNHNRGLLYAKCSWWKHFFQLIWSQSSPWEPLGCRVSDNEALVLIRGQMCLFCPSRLILLRGAAPRS